jgi:hypothetical protein
MVTRKRLATYVSVLFFVLLLGALQAELIMDTFVEVDKTDTDQRLPRFTYTTTSPPGSGAKLRIVPCKNQAFVSYLDLTNPLLSQYDPIQCYVDIIDANGNIVNKDYDGDPNPSATITVTANEIGGSIPSSAKFSQIYTFPHDFTLNSGRGVEFGLSDTEAEQVELHATASGFTVADPVTITFTPPGTITGTVTLPAGTDTTEIWLTAYAQDAGNRDRNIYIIVLPSQLAYPYTVTLLEPGTYKIGFQGYYNFMVADPVKFVSVCELTTPLQETVAAGETKSVGNYNLETCTRGGVEGNVSIAGRADLTGTFTYVTALDDSQLLCNSTIDIIDSLSNYPTISDGNHYRLTCLEAGNYRIVAVAQDLSTIPMKYWWKDAGTVTIPASGMATLDIVLTDEYSRGMYQTILYNSPVEYDAVALLNPNMQWTNDLSQDPTAPVGFDLTGTLYRVFVNDRCGNTMWDQQQIPHVGAAAQNITYGDTSKGVTKSAPQPLNQQQVFEWSVSGMKIYTGYDFPTGSSGWTYYTVSPPFNMPNSSAGGGKLSITATDNASNFGYWQSPLTAIDLNPDMLYRVCMSLSTDVTDRTKVPQIRMRTNASTLQQADYQIIDSLGDGAYSPTTTPQNYYLYFAPQKSAAGTVADFASMAFDLLNFNPGDAANGTVNLHHVEVNLCAEAALTGQTSVGSWDFAGGAGSWQFASSPPFTSPTSGVSGGALLMTATDNTSNFGYWFYNGYFAAQNNRLYRANFSVRSSLTSTSAVPQLRMRFLTQNYQCGRVMEIISSGTGDLSPATTTRNYSLYFYPPQSMSGGGGMSVAFDLLNFDPNDSASAAIYLDDVTVENFDIPTMY